MKIDKTLVKFSAKYPIVDVETTNEIMPSSWSEGDICIAGFFVDENITQFMLINKSNLKKFRDAIKDFLSTIGNRPLYAFNTEVETGCFNTFLGRPLNFNEIKPFNGSGTTKENFYKYMVEKKFIGPDGIGFKDPLKGNSKLCPEYWKKGNHEDVRLHNVCCLTKEAMILEHRERIKKDFSSKLTENGWLKVGVTFP